MHLSPNSRLALTSASSNTYGPARKTDFPANMEEFDALWTSMTDQLRSQIQKFNNDSVLDSIKAFIHAVDWRVRSTHAQRRIRVSGNVTTTISPL